MMAPVVSSVVSFSPRIYQHCLILLESCLDNVWWETVPDQVHQSVSRSHIPLRPHSLEMTIIQTTNTRPYGHNQGDPQDDSQHSGGQWSCSKLQLIIQPCQIEISPWILWMISLMEWSGGWWYSWACWETDCQWSWHTWHPSYSMACLCCSSGPLQE